MPRYCEKCLKPAVWRRLKDHDANGANSEAVCDDHKEKPKYSPETGERLPPSNPNPWMVLVPSSVARLKEAP